MMWVLTALEPPCSKKNLRGFLVRYQNALCLVSFLVWTWWVGFGGKCVPKRGPLISGDSQIRVNQELWEANQQPKPGTRNDSCCGCKEFS